MPITREQFEQMQARLAAGRQRAIQAEVEKGRPKISPKIAEAIKERTSAHEEQAKEKYRIFRAALTSCGIEDPRFEFFFHPTRNWRLDIAWPRQRIAVEVQGGFFSGKPCPSCGQRPGGRHNRGAALLKEHEKLNAAALMGWRLLYTTPELLTKSAFLFTLREVLGIWRPGT